MITLQINLHGFSNEYTEKKHSTDCTVIQLINVRFYKSHITIFQPNCIANGKTGEKKHKNGIKYSVLIETTSKSELPVY